MSAEIVEIKPKSAFSHPKVKLRVMPQHEFSMLIVAPKGSGKTNLIINLLMNHYKGYFHRIVVCSPTVANDPKWEVVKKEKGVLAENKKLKKILSGISEEERKRLPKVVFNNEEEAVDGATTGESSKFSGIIPESAFVESMADIPAVLKEQTDMIAKLRELGYEEEAKYIVDRLLIIEDDQAGLYRGGNTNNDQVNATIKHRHYNSSLIKVTQAYKAMPKTIRTNMNALVMFEIPNQAETDVVYEEWPNFYTKDEWMDLYEYATAEPYGFLYINTHFPRGQRMFKNFEERLRLRLPDQPKKRVLEDKENSEPNKKWRG